VEGIAATWLGHSDETLALFGFGLDSFVEIISGIGIAHMILRFKKNNYDSNDSFEISALKITGTAFYILAAGLSVTIYLNISSRYVPESTFWGIVISAISIITMSLLIYSKEKTGKELNSQPILSDAKCTRACLMMSVILLASSTIYELSGIPFVDSLGAAWIVFYSYREGKECFAKARGEDCCCSDGCKK
jgi:hypothetical protein